MRSRLAALVLSTAVAVLAPLATQAQTAAALTVVPSRDKKVVRRWALPGDPRGVAIGGDGTIYVGLAGPQAVVAVDPLSGAIKKRLVLDSAEIASTKELVTLRTNPERTRLYIANGSDESASILSIPNLGVLREITMEGETIRDVIPDPRGRYVYVLGRHVHVFDKDGQTVVRTLAVEEPMAIAVSSTGSLLAVLAAEDFGNAKATVVALFDANTLAEVEREPLQTEQAIEAVMFAAHDHSLVAFSRDSLYEKPLTIRPVRITDPGKGGSSQMRVEIGDLVNSDHVCLPEGSGPQVATLTSTDSALVYAERRCSVSGTFSGSARGVTPASLYGVDAYAVAYDKVSNTLAVTDRAGFLTVYNVPKPTVVR